MPARLLVRTGTHEREVPLVGSVDVGRDPACGISEADPQLSRRHAEFIAGRDGARVRDLGSRNGIIVNGARVQEATLRPNDVVQIAGLSITYLEEARALAPAPALEPDDDRTRLVGPSAERPDPDKTRLVAPPAAPGPPASSWLSPSGGRSSAILPAKAGSHEESAEAGSREADVVPGLSRASRGSHEERPAAPALPEKKPTQKRSRLSWAARLQVQILLLAAGVFFVTVWPMSWWNSRVLDSVGASRARALTGWLAADASTAFQAGADVSTSPNRVGREAGVVSAIVLAPNGRVLAPASRATESIASIPGLNIAPADVVRLRQIRRGEVIETVEPVIRADGSRAAIVWTTFRATVPPGIGSPLVMIGPALLAALVASLVVAARIRRQTLSGVSSLKEDLELAMAGHLTEVTDPLGAKPVRELTDAVNYLVARLRADDNKGGGRPKPLPRGVAEAGRASGIGAVAGPSAPLRPGAARVVTNASFRITEASPECTDLIGVAPERLVGEHLVDAFPGKAVVDAILKCLSALPDGGEEQTTVTPEDRPYRLIVTVSRAAKDRPVTITLKRVDAGASA